jgi:hypothetical protein
LLLLLTAAPLVLGVLLGQILQQGQLKVTPALAQPLVMVRVGQQVVAGKYLYHGNL